ncbi:MAG: hypothetical protein IKB96_02550 [Prevotella sp.]|nr:hypothetical protein [Prevotella sp.]
MTSHTNVMYKTTDKLIQCLCRQEEQAQRYLLQQYGEMIFGQVARIVTCQEDAEEVIKMCLSRFSAISSRTMRSKPRWQLG